MATDLQNLYKLARKGRTRHRRALEVVARRTGLDPDTVARCLHRARRADEQDARARAKEAS